jgi:hypothetical protein
MRRGTDSEFEFRQFLVRVDLARKMSFAGALDERIRMKSLRQTLSYHLIAYVFMAYLRRG